MLRVNRMKHPEFEKLVKNFEGLLSLAEKQEVAEHLDGCSECAALGEKLENFFSYVNTSLYEPVPQADTARFLNIFQPKKNRSAESQSLSERLFANLIFDDWQMALNERYAATDTRHLLYRAERFEIDFRLNFFGGKCQVSGQIFPDCGTAATAEIYSEETSEKIFLNDYCEFVFPHLKEGIYNFRVTIENKILEIENLSLVS